MYHLLNKISIHKSVYLPLATIAIVLLMANGVTKAETIAVETVKESTKNPGDSTFVKMHPDEVLQRLLLENTKIIPFNRDSSLSHNDSVLELINQFYLNQYRHFQDPAAPMFMFMTNNAKWAMGISGMVKLRGWLDWNGMVDNPDFSPYLINLPPDPAKRLALSATAQSSAIAFTLIGRDTPVGNMLVYIEGNFSGYKNVGFKLKKAYASIEDFTIGLATSTFIDAASETPVIDSNGASGQPSKSNVLVRWQHLIKKHWTICAGAEFSGSSIDADNAQTEGCPKYVPDIVAAVQYGWDHGRSHVRLVGIGRLMRYRDLLTATNHDIPGWAIQASTAIKIIPQLTFYSQFIFGQGHNSYINDLQNDDFDLLGDPSQPGKMYAPRSLCATAGLRYHFLSNIWADLAVGHSRHLPKQNPKDGTYKYGNYLAANVFWNITPRIRTGAEYTVAMRKNFDGMRGTVDRASLLFQLSF